MGVTYGEEISKLFIWRFLQYITTLTISDNNSIDESNSDTEDQTHMNRVLIAKPYCRSAGKGIFLITKKEEIPETGNWVIQEYIGRYFQILFRPFIVNNLKFDLRVYTIVLGYDPLRVYIYNNGLVRFATEEYEEVNSENKGNTFKHLTNFSINKEHPNFVPSIDIGNENRSSHKRTIKDFFKEMAERNIEFSETWTQIKEIITKTIIAAQPTLKHRGACQKSDPYNQGSFEILGFDILIDENKTPYLLEVNHNPSLFTDSQVDKDIKYPMIREVMKLLNATVDEKKRLISLENRMRLEEIHPGDEEFLILKEQCDMERTQFLNDNLECFEKILPIIEDFEAIERYDKFRRVAEHHLKIALRREEDARSRGSKKESNLGKFGFLSNNSTSGRLQNLFGYKPVIKKDREQSPKKKRLLSIATPASPYVNFPKDDDQIWALPEIDSLQRLRKIKSVNNNLRKAQPNLRKSQQENQRDESPPQPETPRNTAEEPVALSLESNKEKLFQLPAVISKPKKKLIGVGQSQAYKKKDIIKPQLFYSPYVKNNHFVKLPNKVKNLKKMGLKILGINDN